MQAGTISLSVNGLGNTYEMGRMRRVAERLSNGKAVSQTEEQELKEYNSIRYEQSKYAGMMNEGNAVDIFI